MRNIKQLKPRDKVTQRMTRDGLIEENQTTGNAESVSERDAEQNLSPQQPTQLFIQPDWTAPPSASELSSPSGGGTAERIIERVDTAHDHQTSKRAVNPGNKAMQEGEAIPLLTTLRAKLPRINSLSPSRQRMVTIFTS